MPWDHQNSNNYTCESNNFVLGLPYTALLVALRHPSFLARVSVVWETGLEGHKERVPRYVSATSATVAEGNSRYGR
jgi:hypothetical protein